MAIRRGPPVWHITFVAATVAKASPESGADEYGVYSAEDMKDLRCMSFTSKATSEILVAGLQSSMFVIDVNKGEIVKRVWSVRCRILGIPTGTRS